MRSSYSIAILLLEEAGRHEIRCGLQVFASDLDDGALIVAREGRYPIAIEADMTEKRLRRFFTREGDHYRVTRELRDMVLVAKHSLLKDPPFSRVDLISCRNVLIYLDREVQQQVCATFHFALHQSGYLFLGSSESADSPVGAFRAIDREIADLSTHVHSVGGTGHAADRRRDIWTGALIAANVGPISRAN